MPMSVMKCQSLRLFPTNNVNVSFVTLDKSFSRLATFAERYLIISSLRSDSRLPGAVLSLKISDCEDDKDLRRISSLRTGVKTFPD